MLIAQIVIGFFAILFLLASIGEKEHSNKRLYAGVGLILAGLWLVSTFSQFVR